MKCQLLRFRARQWCVWFECCRKEEDLQIGVAFSRETWCKLQNYGMPIQGIQVSVLFSRLDAVLKVL